MGLESDDMRKGANIASCHQRIARSRLPTLTPLDQFGREGCSRRVPGDQHGSGKDCEADRVYCDEDSFGCKAHESTVQWGAAYFGCYLSAFVCAMKLIGKADEPGMSVCLPVGDL
ncbi:hypothetical protein PGT21_002742 [Puccinia graminis f. sp. tritici]|uniref:Uncharacterized protein n=1 Tax=Puccinia graminis f. sp. tritici TaxID=56615 RepID=A0A5B0QHB2_PUCGR|nr:hypothetical protein PGT21_002742 [Puccinia graminis f. sp. tritici]KAA1134768.1 hypothetical protein PGTUg99_005264 [Puccinia graminis f. sp. tritici]